MKAFTQTEFGGPAIAALVVVLHLYLPIDALCQSLNSIASPESPLAEYSFGTTYDYISQTFYTAILDTSADSADAATKLNQVYLNQPGLFGRVVFRPLKDERIRMEGYAERSRDYIRGRFNSYVRIGGRGDQFSGNLSLETRQRTGGVALIGDEYILGRGRIKFRHALTKNIKPFIGIHGEFNKLDDTGSTVFSTGYQKYGAQGGIEFDISGFNRLAIQGALEKRLVPDDLSLEYQLARFEIEYSGFSGGAFYTLEVSADRRDFNPLGDDSDQSWFRFGAWGQFGLSDKLALEPRISIEKIDYRLDTSSFNLDQTLSNLELRLVRRWGFTSLGLGPKFQKLNQSKLEGQVTDALLSEDLSESYAEFAGVASFEYFKLRRIILTIENQFGLRDVEIVNDFQSDYWFDRISIFSSLEITAGLKLDIITSFEWEWHDRAADDNAFYLLNSSLTYGF